MDVQHALVALAEPRRRQILRLVRDEPQPVGEIAKHFQVTQQAISHHLKVLLEAGLVTMHPERQRRLYVVDPDGLRSVRDALDEFWPRALSRLKTVVEGEA